MAFWRESDLALILLSEAPRELKAQAGQREALGNAGAFTAMSEVTHRGHNISHSQKTAQPGAVSQGRGCQRRSSRGPWPEGRAGCHSRMRTELWPAQSWALLAPRSPGTTATPEHRTWLLTEIIIIIIPFFPSYIFSCFLFKCHCCKGC